MYAPGYPPTAPRRVPSRAWIVSMRVLFTVLSVFSCGMLLWAPLMRLAIVRRRALDWWLTGLAFAFVVVELMVLGRDGSDADAHGIDFVLIPLLLLAMVAAPTHYLVADIRHYAQLTFRNTGGTTVPQGYGYAAALPPQNPGPPQPAPPQTYPPQQYQQPQPPTQQQPHPAPHPQRIDQVRAELDELSDYLRKEEGR
ncbi:hypothetical protein OG782_14405 [Streptomyces sp. NBC_00876]|uniref:hypothetical protein n=1 Tax=Streptomyces sp. NBC_00876 TaxID=2975853 RepID=UPI00386E0D69|nr:hypothetical protein OG782_14405 [Streptomyces sp. NBC_00876]